MARHASAPLPPAELGQSSQLRQLNALWLLRARTRAREAEEALESEWKSRYGAQHITYTADKETAQTYTLLHFQEAGIVLTVPHNAVPIHVQLTLSASDKRLERYEQLATSAAGSIRDQNLRQRKGK